ncbi:MAG TPA: alpha/beta hydrolase [Anaerolineales bacterium]|nr:alpha/beta hydrolase [Anaerolineales bacterium]
MSALIVRNEIVHYEVLGRGRPVIFLHSWVGSWRDWILTMQPASSRYRCYALDLWGFGDTARVRGRYGQDEQTRLVEEFIDRLGIRKVALVGAGLGGVVAVRFALAHPKAVDRLMLVNTPVAPATINSRLRTAGPADLSLWVYTGLQGSDPYRREAEKAEGEAIKASLEALEAGEPSEISGGRQIACLLVRCENDPVIEGSFTHPNPDDPTLLHQVALETGGHHPMLREPGVFSRLALDFLGLGSGESPANLRLKDEWKRRFR